MLIEISPEAKAYIMNKGGAVTVEAPRPAVG
jgi:hypothetical protein